MTRQKIPYPRYFLSYQELFPKPPGPDIFHLPTDEKGIVMWDYKNRQGLRKEHVPWVISFYALGMFDLFFRTSKELYLEKFFKHADFLVENLIKKGNHGVWITTFPWMAPCYLCEAPWASGMYQGLGLSTMARAWMLSKNRKYVDTAQKALLSFEIPVSKGGVLTVDKNGFWWYDEYACTKTANVLNGFLFALIGIYEFYDSTKDSKALFLFSKGLETTKNYIKKFDLNAFIFKWSRYDDKLLIYSGPKYHKIHVKQLLKLYEFTRDETFLQWANKWLKYERLYTSIASNRLFNYSWNTYTSVLNKLFTFSYSFIEKKNENEGSEEGR